MKAKLSDFGTVRSQPTTAPRPICLYHYIIDACTCVAMVVCYCLISRPILTTGIYIHIRFSLVFILGADECGADEGHAYDVSTHAR
jgi:hypothetical protein